jgi:aspartate kinase
MPLCVQKYGGTSVGNIERIRAVADRIAARRAAGDGIIAVVSAMGDTTDYLLDLARQVTPRPPRRELDMLLTAGERITMSLLAMALEERGVPAISFTGSQSGILTDESHTKARIRDVRAFRLRDELEKGRVVIVAGFQGVSPKKEVTTLGRGGSDTTAVALAVAFGAAECEIYTDVDGVFTADPRVCPRALRLEAVPYDMMLVLASQGAAVLHSRSVELAMKYNTPIRVRSSFDNGAGTRVGPSPAAEAGHVAPMEETLLKAIAHEPQIARVTVRGVPPDAAAVAALFRRLEEAEIPVHNVEQGPPGGALMFVVAAADEDSLSAAIAGLRGEFPSLDAEIERDLGSVSVVGAGLLTRPGVLADALAALAKKGLPVRATHTGSLSLTFLVPRAHVDACVRALHAELLETGP